MSASQRGTALSLPIPGLTQRAMLPGCLSKRNGAKPQQIKAAREEATEQATRTKRGEQQSADADNLDASDPGSPAVELALFGADPLISDAVSVLAFAPGRTLTPEASCLLIDATPHSVEEGKDEEELRLEGEETVEGALEEETASIILLVDKEEVVGLIDLSHEDVRGEEEGGGAETILVSEDEEAEERKTIVIADDEEKREEERRITPRLPLRGKRKRARARVAEEEETRVDGAEERKRRKEQNTADEEENEEEEEWKEPEKAMLMRTPLRSQRSQRTRAATSRRRASVSPGMLRVRKPAIARLNLAPLD